MKNSNIQWIGDIPDDWKVLKNKYNFELSKEIVGVKSASTQLLSLTKNGIKAITEDQQNGKVPASFNTYQVVKKDDIVMCLFDLDVSAVFSGISNYDGMISPAYKCFKCKTHLNPKYVDYYFRAVFVDRKYKRYSKNVRYSISAEEFMTLPILVPPLPTQTPIATYLDAKCSEIDGLIADINKQIDTLNELKKSTITEAVTKGLNKNVKLKDSGIQWIGEIPEGWSKCRLKYLCEITTGNEDTQNADPDGEFPFYVRSPQVERCKRYTFDGEGILIAGDGAGAGRIFHHVFGKYAVHQRVYRLYNFKINTSYLHYYLSNIFPNEMDRGSAQSTVPSMRLPMLLNFNILIPSESEQHAIATYLDTKCSEFDSIISDKQKQISTLETYKKSLIYEYVTGKKEV